jgi:murein DD-endopeptidase MepM/ murein hydrolase activator NlpD
MPANSRLRHALATPALIAGLLVSMTVATPARAEDPEPVTYTVAKRIVLKRKPPTHVLPVDEYRLTAHFGATGYWSSAHTGLDFATAYGAPIRSITRGTVVSAGYDGSYGNKTVIRTPDGTELWFCHLESFAVSVGQTVRPGQFIGYVGLTGNTTGAHLHLEVRPGGGDPVDPYAALAQMGLRP